jgi:hypothetical protein
MVNQVAELSTRESTNQSSSPSSKLDGVEGVALVSTSCSTSFTIQQAG